MAWTINDAVYQVRQIVQDTRSTSYRHPTEKIIGYINNAINDARRLRPDLFIGTGTASTWDPVPIYSINDINVPFPMDPQYFTAVVNYAAGWLGLEDDEFANNGRAVTLFQRFAAQLVSKGV
jgi:hypothetical protein